jgi:hypothetical protein
MSVVLCKFNIIARGMVNAFFDLRLKRGICRIMKDAMATQGVYIGACARVVLFAFSGFCPDAWSVALMK